MQVDFTGLAIIRPHRSSQGRVRQFTPYVCEVLTSLDPRLGRSIRALAMIDDILRPVWARLRSILLSPARDAVQEEDGSHDRSEVRTATSISDLANGNSNPHSAQDLDKLKDAGFSM